MAHRPLPAEDLNHILQHARGPLASLQNARLFITGGTGFFGHWLLESLLHANRELALNVHATVLTRNATVFQNKSPHITGDHAITLLEGDISTFTFTPEQHTHIIHAATDTITDSQDLAESILAGTRRVLDFAQHTGAHRLLYTSSGAVYGRGITSVSRIPETYPAAPLPPNSYDDAKRQAEQLCITHSQNTPLEVSIARCFAFVGPHLPLDAHFAIGNFIRDALSGKPIHIKGDGTPLRSYLYMSDLAIWLWTMLTSAPANRPYNVGSDESISIADLAQLVATILSSRPKSAHFADAAERSQHSLTPTTNLSFRPEPALNLSSRPERSAVERPASQPANLTIQIDGTPTAAPPSTYVPDITRAQAEFNLRVTIPLAEAIRRTAAWHV